MRTRRLCLALDLKDDAAAIAEYERMHQPGNVWPEVIADIRRAQTGAFDGCRQRPLGRRDVAFPTSPDARAIRGQMGANAPHF
jgi:hypothetical protein